MENYSSRLEESTSQIKHSTGRYSWISEDAYRYLTAEEAMDVNRNRGWAAFMRNCSKERKIQTSFPAAFPAPSPNLPPLTIPTGFPKLDAHIGGWQPGNNYVIAGQPAAGLSALALTLAQAFANSGGHLVWIGHRADLRVAANRLVLRDAEVEHDHPYSLVFPDNSLDKYEIFRSFQRINALPIDLFDINDCDEGKVENEFLAEVATDHPTWIVIERSMFDETGLDGLEVLVRRCNLARMLRKLQVTNPTSSVLWQIELAGFTDGRRAKRPGLSDIIESVTLENADVIMFAHREHIASGQSGLRNEAELIIAKNNHGSIGTISMLYEPGFSSWSEIHQQPDSCRELTPD